MPTFTYRASNDSGRIESGRESAASARALERTLSERGLLPIQIAEVARAERARGDGRRSRRADVVQVIRYLATLTEAGFPLDRALGAAQRAAARADVAGTVQAVRDAVRSGSRLADALAAHPQVFPKLALGMVRAGERGGHLGVSLSRLAEQLEREQALRARVLSALLYPLVLASVGVLALMVLLVYVLPRFAVVLVDAGGELPPTTALLLGTAALLSRWWPALLGTPVLLALLVSTYYRHPAGRLRVDRALLHLPVIGPIRRHVAAVRLGRSLATLLRGGLPVLPALDVAADALADEGAAEMVRQAREEVRTGGRLAAALASREVLPPLFIQMLEVGEEGGRLPDMLERAALALEDVLERRLDRAVRLAEPIMIVAFGGAVGFVALALLQAIYGIQPETM